MNLTAKTVNELLRYESKTGKLFWKVRARKWFGSENAFRTWNSRYATKEAFTATNELGCKRGAIFDKGYKAHRVIWLMVTGKWPKEQIDHIDHDPGNNRWVNLREATQKQNGRNTKMHKNNTTGHTGVYWEKRSQTYIAKIMVNGKDIGLGSFSTVHKAAAARNEAQKLYGFHPNHGKAKSPEARR